LLHEVNRDEDSEQVIQRAIVLQKRLVEAHPGNSAYLRDLSLSYNHLGVLHTDRRHHQQAEEALGKARQGFARLTRRATQNAGHEGPRANVCHNCARVMTQTGRHKEAAQGSRAALAIRRKLAAKFPADRAYQDTLAATLFSLAVVLADEQGNVREAEG